ncbi:MAG: hypothetical protein Q4F47_00765 [Bacteroidaceae bacterium]|nr:hypothetical protein [Bacteroidaceae bacterium]
MKKSLLLLAALFVSSMGFAQWEKPAAPKATDMNPGDTLYLYNVEAGQFYAQGNDWGTRASVSYDSGNKVVFSVEEGVDPSEGIYIFGNVLTGGSFNSLDCSDFGGIWVDGAGRAGDGMWTYKKEGDYYTIANTNVPTGNFGIAQIFEGLEGNTRCWIYDASQTYKYDENGEEVTAPKFSGEFWDKWIFVAAADYEAVLTAHQNYGAAMALKAALDKAKADYPAADFSSVEAVYNNTASVKKELQEAQAQIEPIIAAYKASLASFDNPADMTNAIGDGSKFDPWTQTFTGEETLGDKATNTWSTEANNGADGTDMVTPFSQVWKAAGTLLSDQKIHQTLKGLTPGLYKFTANVRVYSEAGKLDQFEGAKMFFGNDSIDLQAETPISYSGNKSVLWKNGGFSIIAIVEEAGDIELGFEIKGANFNWISFKQTSLTYYGNEDVVANSVKLAKEAASLEKMEDVAANPSLVQTYNDAVDAFENAQSIVDVKAALAAAKAAQTAVDENIKAYETLYEKFDVWYNYLIINEGLDGENWYTFCDFMEGEDDIEGYPSPTPTVIKDNEDYSLLTPEIDEYIYLVDSLYSHAVATSLTPGADCTDMIVNPSFSTGDFTGWTYKEGKLGDKNVECYEQVVDIYQVVKDVPDGIYSVSVQAFERPAGNKNYDGSEPSKVFLFMNDFQTPVMNIVKDAIPEAEAVDSVNCLIHSGDVQAPDWPCDYLGTTDGYEWGYVPNSVTGARFAFEAGRYTQKVYGLVEGGEMKLGLTSNGVKAHWVLWANFKLTYEGKTEEALVPVLEGLMATMEDYLDENADNMNNVAAAKLQDAINAANEAYKSTEVDVLWAAVIAANQVMVETRASVNAYLAFAAAVDEMNETADSYYDTASVKAQTAFDEKKDVTAEDLTTEEIEALTVQVKEVTALLKIPAYDNASDETPVDMTSVIVNNGFEEGNLNGWTNSGTIDAQSQDNDSFDNKQGTYYAEKWHVNGTVDLNQTIANLPAGTYDITAYAYSSATDCILYANDGSVAVTTSGLYTVTVKLEEGADLKFGVSWSDSGDKWTCMDEFTLVYYGTESEKELTSTDIEGVESSAVTPVAIYTVSGAQVDALQKGINIVKYSDGSTKKVLVK